MIYLKNSDFLEQIIISQTEGITNKLVEQFQLLIHRVKNTYFTYKDQYVSEDVESEAMLMCLQKYKVFDVNISKNAFAFFTTLIRNEIKLGFKKNVNIIKGGEDIVVVRLSDYEGYYY